MLKYFICSTFLGSWVRAMEGGGRGGKRLRMGDGEWDCGSIKFITLTADKYLCDAQNTCDNRLLKWQCGQLFKCFAAICQRDDKDDGQGGDRKMMKIYVCYVCAYWMTNGSNDPMQCKTLRFISSTRELVNVGSRARWWQDRITKTQQNRKRTTDTEPATPEEEWEKGNGGKATAKTVSNEIPMKTREPLDYEFVCMQTGVNFY